MKKSLKVLGISVMLAAAIPASAYAADQNADEPQQDAAKLHFVSKSPDGTANGPGKEGFSIFLKQKAGTPPLPGAGIPPLPGMLYMGQAKEELLKLLNLDEKTFQDKLKAGETLAQIAQEQGVSRDDLKNALVAAYNNMLEKAKTEFAANVDKLVDGQANVRFFGVGDLGKDGTVRVISQVTDLKAMADLLQLDEATLKQQLASGKSLADIAGERGVDVQKLIDARVEELTKAFEQALKDGKITQQLITDMATKMINAKGGEKFQRIEVRKGGTASAEQGAEQGENQQN